MLVKPVRKDTFLRDFAVIQGGFALFGLALALMIRAGLGTNSWSVLEVALARILGTTPGMMTIATGFMVLVIAVALREEIGWGTLANILCIGPWLDLFLAAIPTGISSLWLRIPMFGVSILIMGLASGIYIGVDAGAGPRDSLMLALRRKTGLPTGLVRGFIEAIVVLVGWILGGPVGLGTLAFTLLIGPAVQLGFRIFRVEGHKPGEPGRGGPGSGENRA